MDVTYRITGIPSRTFSFFLFFVFGTPSRAGSCYFVGSDMMNTGTGMAGFGWLGFWVSAWVVEI